MKDVKNILYKAACGFLLFVLFLYACAFIRWQLIMNDFLLAQGF